VIFILGFWIKIVSAVHRRDFPARWVRRAIGWKTPAGPWAENFAVRMFTLVYFGGGFGCRYCIADGLLSSHGRILPSAQILSRIKN
jgi:hypothetical protein